MTITTLTKIETINLLKAQNAGKTWSGHANRLLYDLHQFAGVDFEKPFKAAVINGNFTLSQIEKELKPEGRYIIGLTPKYGKMGLQFATVNAGRLDLFPCQFSQNIWRKADFNEGRKLPTVRAIVIYQCGLVCRSYGETPEQVKTNNARNEEQNRKASRAARLRQLKAQRNAERFQKITTKSADIETAERLKKSVLRDFIEAAEKVTCADDLKRFENYYLRSLLKAIGRFEETARAEEGTETNYNGKKADIDWNFKMYAANLLD